MSSQATRACLLSPGSPIVVVGMVETVEGPGPHEILVNPAFRLPSKSTWLPFKGHLPVLIRLHHRQSLMWLSGEQLLG